MVIIDPQDPRGTRTVEPEETKEVYELARYADPETDEKMKEFVKDIIRAITTGEEAEDKKSIEVFAT
jgi:hypothetical protein